MAGRNPDDFPGRWITVTEAIGIFGVSERTIRRRIATGLLPIKHESGRVLIYLYDTPPDNRQAAPEGGKVAGERLTELQAENRRLSDLLAQVEGERDFLRSALATSMQNEQRLIEAGDVATASTLRSETQASQAEADLPQGKTRRWWWPW